MNYFSDTKQNDFKADFGFMPPHRTKTECKHPVFMDHHLHRIALMKDEHFGSKGDRDENGIPGWVSKPTCTGCGKKFKNGYFHIDKASTLQ